MALQVPSYKSVPTETAQDSRTPSLSTNAPVEAFGGATAQALQGLGKVQEGIGNELYTRAIAMQTIHSESEAKEADAKYMMAAGELHAGYSSLQGRAAVDGYPQYMKDLDATRKQIREGMSNDAARKMYDGSSLSTMGRTIFNGAGHAATENKKYALGASNARITGLGDQALLQPKDDVAFQSSLVQTRDEVSQQGELLGWSPEQVQQATAEQTSALWTKRIEGLSKSAPFQAQKILDEAVKRGDIRGESVAKITNTVRQQMYTVGARQVSHDVSSGADLVPGSKPVDLPQARQAIGKFESGENYEARGPQVTSRSGVDRGRALGKYQVMPENLAPWLKEAGLPSMTPEEFLKSPKAQDQVFDVIFGGYMQKYGSFNEAASRWFTGRSVAEATAAGANDKFKTVGQYLQGTNVYLAQNAPLAERVERGKQVASALSPEDPLFQDYVANRVTTDYGQQLAIKRNDTYNNKQVIESALMGGPDGKLPTTLEELRATPEAEAAWNALDPQVQRSYMGVLVKNAKGDTAWNDAALRRYQTLKGLAQADPAEFLDTDVVNENLPLTARKELANLQIKLKAKAEGDPRVTKALQVLGPQLQAARIGREFNKETYFQFVGSLQDALQDWANETQKPPRAEDIQKIGSRLLQGQATPWALNPWSKTETFKIPVPSEEAEKIKADPKWGEIGVTPNDEQVQRVYSRRLYQELYGGKAKQDAKTPVVPMSR